MIATTELLKMIEGSIICKIDGDEKLYISGDEAADELEGYRVTSISADVGKVVLTMQKENIVPNDLNADWVKEHVEKYGQKPGFF